MRWLAALVTVALVLGLFAAREWTRLNAVRLPPLPPPAHEARPTLACEEEVAAARIEVEWAPPETWGEALAKSDAVIVGRLERRRPEVLKLEPCLFYTRYFFAVEQTIKGTVRVGDGVCVLWTGRPIDSVNDEPKPKIGERFLFFLHAAHGDYSSLGGPLTRLRVADGNVIGGESSYPRPKVGVMRLADFLASLAARNR